ncbi:hypothetical protein B0J13DRAFT_626194 [Dactylonectria estremocensis]|uniref:Uncharacterized protein n=1 Tax=Dactylonectria estremocensis TaxID=1079267 RepID=A0A9P9E656_9HYPO|nr:hypothetical protein B0J13DRAFT_626194 [Dactylonectria estremocensis]
MSGLEVAGVVLGVLPLVITALSAYKQGKGVLASLRKFRGLLDDLIHQLQTQKTAFYLDILDLLREARVPGILQCGGDPTEETCANILLDAKTGTQVHDYLGHPAPKDDLSNIIHASKMQNASLVLKGRLKFTIDRKTLDALVKDLGTERYSLGKLIKRVKTKREWEANELTNSSTTLTLAFARVRESATLLYGTACECWACEHHGLHTVMIRLDHRIGTDSTKKTRPSTDLGLFFPIKESVLQGIEVAARVAEPLRKPIVKFKNIHNDGLEVPAITVTEACDRLSPARIQIKSIFDDAQHARNQGQVLALELMSDALGLSDAKHKPHQSYNISTTLTGFLKDTAPDEDARMNPLNETLLTLNVVSSALQLRPTVWCNIPWNSMSIKFPIPLEDDLRIPVYTPYVELAVDAGLLQSHTCSPELTTTAAKTTMLELAIPAKDTTSQVHGGLGSKESARRHANMHGPDACCHLLVGAKHEQITASSCQGH